jgi:hypothetical protein
MDDEILDSRVGFAHNSISSLCCAGISGFAGVEVVLAGFSVDDFAGSSFLESLGCALVSLSLWHVFLNSYLVGLTITVETNGPCLLGSTSVTKVGMWVKKAFTRSKAISG